MEPRWVRFGFCRNLLSRVPVTLVLFAHSHLDRVVVCLMILEEREVLNKLTTMNGPTKERVESCLTIGPPSGVLHDTKSTWYWERYGWRVQYRVSAASSQLRLTFNHGLPVEQNVRLDHTEPNYGGVRWWFLCPKCKRRVSRLHLPSHAYYFFCRHCHDLSYESAQSSRTWSEGFFQKIARDLGTTTRVARLWFRVTRGGVVHEVKRPIIERVRDRRTGVALAVTKAARANGLTV